jgi:hypothetical protein
MKVAMSGTRSGVDWPPYGGVLECGDAEGAQLCAAGIAEPVAEPERVETATLPAADVEARAETPEPARATRRRGSGS